MPYIAQKDRPEIDQHIGPLTVTIGEKHKTYQERAGVLNYTCTKLALNLFPERKYWTIALVIGVFVTVVLEYYRKRAGPYEDEKIVENGDVY